MSPSSPASAELAVDSLSFSEIAAIARLGSPSFYLLDLDQLAQNCRLFESAFAAEYPRAQLAYSLKTNYLPAVCRTLKDLGCWAEVVSEMEYEIATQRVGFEPTQVIVNGPLHEPDFLQRALLEGAFPNLDSWYLFDRVADICRAHPERPFRVGVRFTYPIVEGGISRFGIEASESNFERLLRWQAETCNCRIVGVHSHFSDSSRSLASFLSRVRGLLDATDRLFGAERPEVVNVGGGFLGAMPTSLASQYGENLPDFRAYAATIAGTVRGHYSTGPDPLLIAEPGTALIANAMVFACKVYEVKRSFGKTLALVNGSNHNINHRWQGESLPIRIVRRRPPTGAPDTDACFDIVGNTCIEKDVLCHDVTGMIEAGDYVVFQYMGGYSNVLKQPFIHPCQPIWARQDGRLTLVKRQETAADILATYL